MVAPAFNANPEGLGMISALPLHHRGLRGGSGFHSLVAAGPAASRSSESDVRFVGYGSMLIGRFSRHLGIACGAGSGMGVVSAGGEALSGEAAGASVYGALGIPAKGGIWAP